ncbi:hypothetical protein ACIRQP_19300 [Streptomyces sp. NPDC102274]|uniref:hypothetical protein n=1 Tax=Streptomyces sp. NPDC102274 TaxID=3366151 RepID=UPI0038192505
MDLRVALRRTAMKRPAVFLVTWPGATGTRLGVEAELRRRGWPVMASPAAADGLVVCGAPVPARARWLDDLERSVPRPAVRVTVTEPGDAARLLDDVRARLWAQPGTGTTPRPTRREPTPRGAHGPRTRPDGDGHEGHGGHDGHHGHDTHAMSEVAGLPLAERADDRDGLRLDQLHVPLGPALADWPAGLILRCALQGDIVQRADAGHLPGTPHGAPFWPAPWLRAARGAHITRGTAARRRCAAHLDSLGRLLAVVGWADPAARSRRLRDEVLAGPDPARTTAELHRLAGRVGRSRPLRWLLTGLGPLPAARARERGVTGPALAADGDAYARLHLWLTEIGRAVGDFDDTRPLAPGDMRGPRGDLDGDRPPSRALLDVLPELLAGAEFWCARVILASLDPDIDEVAATPAAGTAHV